MHTPRHCGRDGWEVDPQARPFGGAWRGPIFILTHHPEDAAPAEAVTLLNCDVTEVVRISLEAGGGKYVEVFSPTIGHQLLERGLIDEIDLQIAPVMLGDGISRSGSDMPVAPIPLWLGRAVPPGSRGVGNFWPSTRGWW